MPDMANFEISVAVATYNGEAFVAETLQSILGQSLKPNEIIIVDDGSIDTTPDILARFGADIRVITIENSGPEAAKKTAIEATNGEWIAICDHDDLWDADHLEQLAALVLKYPEVGAVYSNFAEFDGAARYPDKFSSFGEAYWQDCPEDEEGFRIYGPEPFAMLLHGNPFFPSAGMFRRALYNEIGGIRLGLSRNPAADGDMTSRMVIQGIIGCDSNITVRIRKYGGNFSGEGFKTSRGDILLREGQLAEGGIFALYQHNLKACIKRQALAMLQAAFSYRNKEAFKFASKRLVFSELPIGLKFRFLVFQLPGVFLASFFMLVRQFQK